jgi:hypothetical protein
MCTQQTHTLFYLSTLIHHRYPCASPCAAALLHIPCVQSTGLDQQLTAASDPAYTEPTLPQEQVQIDLPWWFAGAQGAAGAAPPSPPPLPPPASPPPPGVPAAGPYTVQYLRAAVSGGRDVMMCGPACNDPLSLSPPHPFCLHHVTEKGRVHLAERGGGLAAQPPLSCPVGGLHPHLYAVTAALLHTLRSCWRPQTTPLMTCSPTWQEGRASCPWTNCCGCLSCGTS